MSLLLLGPALVLSACSSGESDPDATPAQRAQPAPSPSTPPGFRAAGGVAYRLGLPLQPAYIDKPVEERENGTLIRSWTYDLGEDQPLCFITAAEQPKWTGNFPQALLLTYETLNSEAGNGKDIKLNEQVAPPPGAVGAVRQELTYPIQLFNGKTPPGRSYQNQYVTPGGTLIAIAIAVPEDAIDRCRAKDILASVQMTGQDPPAPGKSASGTG